MTSAELAVLLVSWLCYFNQCMAWQETVTSHSEILPLITSTCFFLAVSCLF